MFTYDPAMTDPNVEWMAKAIFDALELGDEGAYLGVFSMDSPVTIDGKFDLAVVAEEVLRHVVAGWQVTIPVDVG